MNGIHTELGGSSIEPWRWDQIHEASAPLLSGCGVGSDLWIRGTDRWRSGDEGDVGSLPLQLCRKPPWGCTSGQAVPSPAGSTDRTTAGDPAGCCVGLCPEDQAKAGTSKSINPPQRRVSPSECTATASADDAWSPRSSSLPAQRSQCLSISAPPLPTRFQLHPMGLRAKLGAQQMFLLQEMFLPRGWGSSSTSLCSTRLNPQHLPQLQEERGLGPHNSPLTNIPQQVHSCCQAEERGRGADRVIPCSRDGVWGKNHPLPPSGSG